MTDSVAIRRILDYLGLSPEPQQKPPLHATSCAMAARSRSSPCRTTGASCPPPVPLPVDEFVWELPAGRLDAGEAPEAAAQRELQEEIGYRAKSPA